MAVVINDFEVVPAKAPPAPKAGGAESGGGDKPAPPSEHELERLVEKRLAREERVWAH
jgi:hypothetical protein